MQKGVYRMRETVVEKYLRKRCQENDFLCYKFVSPSNNGVPDRILIGHGMTLFVELKAPGQKPRELQNIVFERMRNHGATVYVVDTKEGVDQLLHDLLNP